MSKNLQTLSENCLVCSGSLIEVAELPHFPITGIYSSQGVDPSFPHFDQGLMICESCGHGQLKNLVSTDFLYNQDYGFRTSQSETASKGVDFYANYLRRLTQGKRFNRVLEFGCSDAVLLKKITDIGKEFLGIDPVVPESKSWQEKDSTVRLMKGVVETTPFEEILGGKPDLVLSEHTLEHIVDPKKLIVDLASRSADDALFVFEFPCFNPLVESFRFDQVFHQHLHYFSLASVERMLTQIGMEIIDYTIHYSYWGALIVAFKKSSQKSKFAFSRIQAHEIKLRYKEFERMMGLSSSEFKKLASQPGEKWSGYGAALMLPVLAYHFKTDFHELDFVFDDDLSKKGLQYVNLPVKITTPEQNDDFSDQSILLTAMDNRRPILRRLGEKRPKRIINPLPFL